MTPQERARLGGLARAAKLWKQGRGGRRWSPFVRALAREAMAHVYETELLRARVFPPGEHYPGDGMKCGAVTRSGTLCRNVPVFGRCRCRMHGGASTGPKTREGKARALEALARGRATLAARAR